MHVKTKKDDLHFGETIFMSFQGATIKNIPPGAMFCYQLIILSQLILPPTIISPYRL